jgi:DNA repair protein RadC
MVTYELGQQLPLPLAPRRGEPQIADSTPAPPTRRNAAHYLLCDLSDAALLTTLLGPSTAPQCERLMADYANLREVAALNPAVLLTHGFTTAALTRLEAVFEVAKRYGETEWVPGQPFRGSGDIYAHFRERLAVETCELFYAVLLDNKHRKIRDLVVSKGSLTASIVHPRDVFGQIVRHAAAAVVFVHNHPSGEPTPSKEDLEITRRLREVGDIIGVRVLDHVVIGRGRYVSFVDDGYW